MDGELDVAMPGGQTGAQVVARFDAVVAELTEMVADRAGDEGVVTLVAHGAVLRTWATVRGADEAVRRELFERFHPLHNTGLIVMNGRPDGGWLMESWAGRALGGARLDDGAADGPAGGDPTGADPVAGGSGTAGAAAGGGGIVDPTAGMADPTAGRAGQRAGRPAPDRAGSGPGPDGGLAGASGRRSGR